MDQPLVSVVLTNYNGERFVGSAIESVLRQTYAHWELIIVDDCSTDRSLDVIGRYRDERIRLIRNETNQHVSTAHNRGNAAARGDYLAALDNDDLWKPDKLEKQIAWMENHPETGVCLTWTDFVDEQGVPFELDVLRKLFSVGNRSRIQWVHDLLTTGNHFANDSAMIRASLLRAAGDNDPCLIQLHDYDLFVRLAMQTDFHILEEPLMSYRKYRGSGSISENSGANERRLAFEYAWIISQAVLRMEISLFREVFREEMIHPEAESPEEILCEKALLLGSDHLHENCRYAAFALFEEIFRSPEACEKLRTQYGCTQHDVYRMTGMPVLFSKNTDMELAETREALRQAQKRCEEKDTELQHIKHSLYWRMISPVRNLMQRLRSK